MLFSLDKASYIYLLLKSKIVCPQCYVSFFLWYLNMVSNINKFFISKVENSSMVTTIVLTAVKLAC